MRLAIARMHRAAWESGAAPWGKRRLTFTEIALEMSDDRVAMCRHTAPPSTTHGVFRILDQGRNSGRFVGMFTFVGSRDAAQEFARDLVRERSSTEVEMLGQDVESTTFRVSAAIDTRDASQARLLPVLRLFEKLGPETIVEPILFRNGRVRARLIVPRLIDNATVHAAVSEVQDISGYRELRVLRVSRLEPDRHIEVMRPLLNAEQDGLLRLAVSMGYYANPKRATLEDISARVGLSISPIHKRLKAAEETLVGVHVVGGRPSAQAPPQPVFARRRVRRRGALAAGTPCEIDFLVRAPQHPVSRFVRSNRGVRALMLPISEDARSGQASWLLVALAARAQVDALAAALLAEPGVRTEEVVREDGHTCFRVHGYADRGFGIANFTSSFAGTAALRRLVFDGDEMYGRLTVTCSEPVEDVEARLTKAVAGLGWPEPEVLSVAPTGAGRVPSELPEPLSARQEEVLKVAHALGYYRTPRGCTLEQVATTLGVSANAIHKNLVGAEARIIAHYLTVGA